MFNGNAIRAARAAAGLAKWAAIVAAGFGIAASAWGQQTINNAQLQTWWHGNYELNSTTAVADQNVRRSTYYDVRVGSGASPSAYYDSFTYMSIPRSGRDKWGYTHEDGAEFPDAANLTMSWSSFLYGADAWVEVSLRTGQTISSVNEVTIRPTTYNFEKQLVDSDTIRIRVPYSVNGYRFSVEFNNQLYTAYNDMSGTSGQLTTNAGGNREIHTEPRNSLLIFAEPILTGSEANRLIPKDSDGSIYYPAEGQVNNLNNVGAEIVFFRPGTYYMPWNYHALLPAHVKWVYLAPGAYVKGAFRFPSDSQSVYKVTGYGALSGEKYVYEPDTANGYQHRVASNCHASCVKMLQFQSSNAQQYLDLQGVTIVEPPYHSFVVYGNEDTFQMRVESYKQVGSWYWQTDGIELYTNSTMKNTFFNANDDVLKIYHSGVTVDNTVIWKNENGPVIQWGWVPRNIQNITVRNTEVIHNRMYWKDVKINTCIINASPHWEDTGSTTRADPNQWVKNILIDGLRVEGKTNCAIRLYALSSTENIHIKGLDIGGWNSLDSSSQVSHLKRYSNSGGQLVTLGNQSTQNRGIKLENYRVGGVAVTRAADNWRADQLGRLGFDANTFDSWDAFGESPPPCTTQQTVSFAAIADQQVGATVSLSATATSGLPVTFSVTAGNASVSGSTLTVGNTTGTVTVRASQAGNATYCPASADRSFSVTNPNAPRWVGGTFTSWVLTGMTSTGSGNFELVRNISAGNHQLKFADTNNWTGKDWGGASGLSGTAVETTGGGPNISFTLSATAEYRIRFNSSTLVYSIAPTTPSCTAQSITFAAIPDQQLGATVTLSASATSQLPVTFAVTAGSATVSGSTLTVGNTAGTITVEARQAGNATYCAATPVSRSFTAGSPPPDTSPRWLGASFTNWSLTPMTLVGGNFEIVRSLSSGNHQLKFANTSNWSGKDWGGASGLSGTAVETTGGGANIAFSIATAGDYLIRFNSTTLQYSITQVAASVPIWVAGTFSNWSLGSMTATSSGYRATRTLSAGNHELKFANTSNWSGTDWGNANGLSGTATVTTGGLPNIRFAITQSGSYAINFNLQTLAYSIAPAP